MNDRFIQLKAIEDKESPYMRLAVTADNRHSWSLVVSDLETGKILPVAANEIIVVTMDPDDKYIRVDCTLLMETAEFKELLLDATPQ